MLNHEKKTALVTGGAKGIGRAVAEALAEKHFDIAIADILPDGQVQDAANACRAHGAEVCVIQADVSDADARKKIVDIVKERFGRLDVLVNNAGVAPEVRADVLEASEESYDRIMNINLKGPYFLTQSVANWMIAQKQQDETRIPIIINIASLSSYTSSPSRGEYCLSKAGVSMMTKLYADRLAEYGLYVYEIRPGIIKTDMTAAVRDKYDKLISEGLTPIRRWGRPEDVGRAAAALATLSLPFSTGEVINVDGGFHLKRL